MPEIGPLTAGTDTWVSQAGPTTKHGSDAYLRLRAGSGQQARILLGMPIKVPAGAVALQALLSTRARFDMAAQTLTVRALDGKWTAAGASWNNQPGVTGPTATLALPATAGGTRFSIDVTDLVQLVVDGAPNHGWRISTDATDMQRVFGFDAGGPAWQLTIAYSVPSQTPTGLAPEGVIGIDKWVCSVDDTNDLAALRVQVDPAASSAPAFDSGWVSTTTPQLALAGTAYPGLADAASTWWRTRARTLDGGETDWSDWVQVTRHVKPTIVMDNPAGSILYSPTATIAAHLSPAGDEDTIWNVVIRDTLTGQRYNSSLLGGADLAHELPLKFGGKTILPGVGPYTLQLRAQDRRDRVASPGDPTYVEELLEFTVGTDVEATVPTMVWAHQEGDSPNVRLRWTTVPVDVDGFFLFRDGVVVDWLGDVDTIEVEDGVYEWVDVEATPNTRHTYAAVTQYEGGWSARSNEVEVDTVVESVWLVSRFGAVALGGKPDNLKRSDKRTSYNLPYSPNTVDVITAIAGYSGGFDGYIDVFHNDLAADRAVLDQVRENPQYPVRLSWGTVGAWVHLQSLSVDPLDPDYLPRNRMLRVLWEDMNETDDTDVDDVVAGLL